MRGIPSQSGQAGRLVTRPFRVTVSGSFRRHMAEVRDDVERWRHRGVQVLSPEDPQIVDAIGDFVFVASDRHRSIRLTEDRHLDAIRHSDFLWLVCPDGYVGPSASLELGFALAFSVPVFSAAMPSDATHRHYVTVVSRLEEVLTSIGQERSNEAVTSLLLDPDHAVERGYEALTTISAALTKSNIETVKREACFASAAKALRTILPR